MDEPRTVVTESQPAPASSAGPVPKMFTELLEKVVRHEDLTEAEAAGAMREVMEGRAPAASLAALLAALVMKGERPAEIVVREDDARAA